MTHALTRGVLICSALALLAVPLAAQAQSASDVAAARALFEEGVRLAEGGDLGGAEERFRRSLALNPAPAVAFNLAYVLSQQGRAAEAVDYYSQVASSPAAPADLRQQASLRSQQLQPRLARLRVSLLGPPDGVSLRIGRRLLGAAAIGVPIHVDAGALRVEAMRGGSPVAFGDVSIAAGMEAALSLRIPPGEPIWASPWLWTIAGAVVAGAVVAIVLGFALSGSDPSHTGNIPPGVVVLP